VAATAGAVPTAQIWSHFGNPIGARASAMVISTPKRAKARTKAAIGAREP